jgi:hypothetical protein
MTITATDSLTGTNFKELKLYEGLQQNYILIADNGVVNEPASGYVFYVDADVSNTTITFNGNNNDIDTLTFNCPVIFTTRPLSGTGLGNNKNITIKGKVVFNKGVIFETNGRFNTQVTDLSIFNFGDGIDPFSMVCKYTNATIAANLVPLNINGYGKINFNNNCVIDAYIQPFSVACIDQLSNIANINQDGGNILNVYLDSQMIGTNLIDMRQTIVYPDIAPLIYNLYIIADVEIQLIRFPQSYNIYVTATNATLTDIEFTETANINIADGAQLSFEASSFSGTSPLINLTGNGSLNFDSDNNLNPMDTSGVLFSNNNVTIITSSSSNINLPLTYNFSDPVEHYEGFTFVIDSNGTYNFGTFSNKTLYIFAKSNSTSSITINANYGIFLTVDSGSTVNLNNCNIYAVDTYNNNYGLYKENNGIFRFTGTNKIFAGSNTFFLTDINIDNSSTYVDINEDNCKFYLIDDTEGSTEFTFDNNNYNLNSLYYLASQGVYIGTDGGEYNITANFLIQKDNGTLILNSELGLGLLLLNDVSGSNLCSNFSIKGVVGDSDISGILSSRIIFDTSGCNIAITDMDFYDNNYVPSPLLVGDNANITFGSNVNFFMNSSSLTYLYNNNGDNITNKDNAFIIIGSIRNDKQYNFNINLTDTTTEPPFVFNNNGWYESPIKFASDYIYDISGINSNNLILYTTNSPIVQLYSLNPLTIYNVTDSNMTIDSASILSNINNDTISPLILQTNDLNMTINLNSSIFNVYGYGSISKTGNGEISFNNAYGSKDITSSEGFTVGNLVNKDMDNTNYNNTINPNSFQGLFFPGMANFTSENIVQGDKTVETRLTASYWLDLRDDVFDSWGFFYIYDVTTGKYYFPLINPQNQNDGVLTTQTFNAFNRTFTIRHGWTVQGIFKFDITASDNLPFRFGAYGNMGSDGNESFENLIYNASNITLYYHRHSQTGSFNEQLYSYFIPKTVSENNSQTYNVYYSGDNMSMVSNEVTNGLIVYFSKSIDTKEWISNDIELTDGGNITVTLNYYTNDYDLDISGIVPILEYNVIINIFDSNYSFVDASGRLSFKTNGNSNNPIFTSNTNITNGLSLNHTTNGTVTFDQINFNMNNNDGGFIIDGSGVVNCSGCVIQSTFNVTEDLIKLIGSNLFTIIGGTLINDGSGNFINLGNSARLTINSATITNNNGSIIYSTSSNNSNVNLIFNQVIFNNNTNSSIITHLNNSNIDISSCQINQSVFRTGEIITFGNNNSTINSNLIMYGTNDVSGIYQYFIKAYTLGNINTGSTNMNATNTNIYWVNLEQAYNNGANTSPYSSQTGFAYAAYSFDPVDIVQFEHRDTGTGMYLDDSLVTQYNVYIAVGNDDTKIFTATLEATQYTDLCGNTITNNLSDIFTSDIFNTELIGSINNSNTQTFDVSGTNRVIPIQLEFGDSHLVYIGDIDIDISFNTVLSTFKYSINETVSAPNISVDNDTLEVLDTIVIEQYVTFNLSKGYILPLYILPVNNNIISFFKFKNTADPAVYVSYDIYSGYPNTVNKNLIQKIDSLTTTQDFYLEYVGTGIYYEPGGFARATIDIALYSDNINQSLVFNTFDNNASIIINNDTVDVRYPLSYIATLSDISNNIILYDVNNGTESGTLVRVNPADFSSFKIRYTFTLKFLMPLITFSGEEHQINITGIDYYDINNITYNFSDPSGCVIDSSGNNSCVIKYDGNDLTEKTVNIQVDVTNLDTTNNGNIYFKKPNHQIQLQLYNQVSLKGFNSDNQIIEVSSLTQNANSYYSFPNTILISADGVTYDENDSSPTINIDKGDTKSISIITAGIITNDTPGISGGSLGIDISLTTSKISAIMPTSLDDNNTITVTTGNYQGSKEITFTDNNLISGSGSTYTITFDQTDYTTVPSIIYSDNSRQHIITHRFAIQPNTRELSSMNYSSNDNSQAPGAFTVSSNPTVSPSSYNIGFPIGVESDFISYNTTNGATTSFRVNYILVGIDASNTSLEFIKDTDYKTYKSDMTTSENNYIDINSDNYDETQYIYFSLLTKNYQYIDIYVYYTNISGTDLVNIPANSSGNKIKIARYDFSNGFPTETETLQINLGSWSIKPDSNGNLIFIYNGTINNDNASGVGSKFILPAPTSLVNKIITTENL